MKKFLRCLTAVVMLAGICCEVFAQQNNSEQPPLKLKKFSALSGSGVLVGSPDVDIRDLPGISKSGKAPEWRRMNVEYETYPEWLDGLSIEFIVVTLKVTKEAGVTKQNYSVFRKKVAYQDVEKGRKHFAVAFLHPNAEKRYGPAVATAVILSVDGKTIEESGEVASAVRRIFGENWWNNPRIMESDVLVPRTGYLLSKKESPFALMNIDSYEVIK